MKRHSCTFCGAKRNADKMTFVEYKLIKKSGWVCSFHVSDKPDITTIRASKNKPVFIELFSGSKHVSTAASKIGFNSISIDVESKYNPDIVVDIENLRRTQLPGSVAVVWASIPCTVYSILNLESHWEKISIGYRQYYYSPCSAEAIKALRILHKTIRLIKQMNPVYYFIENPRGALRHFPQMAFVPYRKTVSYADYGLEVYKPTDIFTNCEQFKPKPIRSAMGRKFKQDISSMNNAYERSLIAPALIDYVLSCCSVLLK